MAADRYNPSALVNKGNVLFARSEYEKALHFYKEAVNIESSCVEALFNMGMYYHIWVCQLLLLYMGISAKYLPYTGMSAALPSLGMSAVLPYLVLSAALPYMGTVCQLHLPYLDKSSTFTMYGYISHVAIFGYVSCFTIFGCVSCFAIQVYIVVICV